MHISVCEFLNVFKRIKIQNYNYLEELEALASSSAYTVNSSLLQVLLCGTPSVIHTDFI